MVGQRSIRQMRRLLICGYYVLRDRSIGARLTQKDLNPVSYFIRSQQRGILDSTKMSPQLNDYLGIDRCCPASNYKLPDMTSFLRIADKQQQTKRGSLGSGLFYASRDSVTITAREGFIVPSFRYNHGSQ